MELDVKKATAIQKSFEETVIRGKSGILGVGIGLNKDENDLALNVQVRTTADKASLPKKYEGMDIIADVVGVNKAFSK